MVAFCDCFFPICTSVNVRLTGTAASVAGVTELVPVPDNATSMLLLDALSVSDKMPLLEPVDEGVKVTPKVAL